MPSADSRRPTFAMVAGADAAGKSAWLGAYADRVPPRLDSADPATVAAAVARRDSFTIETPFTAPARLRAVRTAHRAAYRMHAVVLVTAGADIHLARATAARPSPAAVRRRVRALPNNVVAAVGYFNRLEVFDSTAGFDCVFVADWLDDQWTGDGAPHWCVYLSQLLYADWPAAAFFDLAPTYPPPAPVSPAAFARR